MSTERISFSEFCKKVFPTGRRSGRITSGQFVLKMLEVCGCTEFHDSETTPKKLHSGYDGRRFIPAFRRYCKSFDLVKTQEFFVGIIESEDANRIAREFRVPFSGEVSKETLALVLAYQLKAFIENKEEDDAVDDIVACEYKRIISSPKEPIQTKVIVHPLYSGDDFRRLFQQSLEAKCYEDLPVILTVLNTGKQVWKDRKLVLKSELHHSVAISDTEFKLECIKPNDMATVRFKMRFRDEGTFPFIWQIVDYNGDDCFPNKEDMLSFVVSVTYIPHKEGRPGVI